MAIVIEGVAIVAMRKRIREYFPNGEEGFEACASDGRVVRDEFLIAALFDDPEGAVRFGGVLYSRRLQGSVMRLGWDFAVVNEARGVELNLPWLEFAVRPPLEGRFPISAVAFQLEGSDRVDWARELMVCAAPAKTRPSSSDHLEPVSMEALEWATSLTFEEAAKELGVLATRMLRLLRTTVGTPLGRVPRMLGLTRLPDLNSLATEVSQVTFALEELSLRWKGPTRIIRADYGELLLDDALGAAIEASFALSIFVGRAEWRFGALSGSRTAMATVLVHLDQLRSRLTVLEMLKPGAVDIDP